MPVCDNHIMMLVEDCKVNHPLILYIGHSDKFSNINAQIRKTKLKIHVAVKKLIVVLKLLESREIKAKINV